MKNKKIFSKISLMAVVFAALLSFSSCATGEGGGDWTQLIWFGVLGIVVVGIFMFGSRGNKKREREVEKMRGELEPGDEVTTIGGIVGRVVSVSEKTFVLETSREKTNIRFLKTALKSVDVKFNTPVEELPTPSEEEKPSDKADKE